MNSLMEYKGYHTKVDLITQIRFLSEKFWV